MVAETDIQRQLINSAEETGGYGLKLSNRFIVGVPDLILAMPIPPMYSFIEMKKDDWPKTSDVVTWGVTKIQENTLVTMQNAGLRAAMGIAIKHPEMGWTAWFTKHITTKCMVRKKVYELECVVKENGQWPIESILRMCM